MELTNNTILITGGGTGIGRGLAEAFHALGNRVIISGRSEKPLQETAEANAGMKWLTLDVADPKSVSTFAARVATEHPQLNVLINNAGVMRLENLREQSAETADAEAMVTTNLLGPIRLTAALLPLLRKQSRPTIINVSSGLAFVPLALTPTYCATKAAIHSYTESLRYQLKDAGVEVLELIPPYVQTTLMGAHQASDPDAMPLDEFISEVMQLLKKHPEAKEILVKKVEPLRFAADGGQEKYERFFAQFNDMMTAARSGR